LVGKKGSTREQDGKKNIICQAKQQREGNQIRKREFGCVRVGSLKFVSKNSNPDRCEPRVEEPRNLRERERKWLGPWRGVGVLPTVKMRTRRVVLKKTKSKSGREWGGWTGKNRNADRSGEGRNRLKKEKKKGHHA